VKHYSGGVKRSATLDPNLAKHPDTGILLNGEDHALVLSCGRSPMKNFNTEFSRC
jgi:hypothetical protein